MPRITTGAAKGKNLILPNIPNIRAVQDVVKLSIFSILGEKITNAEVLDLFAGSGSLGLEALSRGATWVDFVDQDYRAVEAVEKNLKNAGFDERHAQVIQSDSVKYAANTEKKYDIIFADPFYEDTKHKFLIQNLAELLKEDGVIVFLHGKQLNMAELLKGTDLNIVTERKFGNGFFTVLNRQ